MSAAARLGNITSTQAASTPAVSIAASITGAARKTVDKQVDIGRKSLIGKASALDVVTSSNAARNTIETIVKFRDQFIQTVKDIVNMQI